MAIPQATIHCNCVLRQEPLRKATLLEEIKLTRNDKMLLLSTPKYV